MKNTIFLVSLLAVLVLSACAAPAAPSQGGQQAAPAQQQSNEPSRTIMVNGSGQVNMTPDIAYLSVGVQSQSEDVAEALAQNNDKAQAVSTSLQELGIAANDIQTSNFSIYPQQQYGPNGEVTSTVYVVNNTVYITVRDLQVLGRMLDVVVRTGANSINGINFDVQDKSQAVSEARRLAIESAKSQAEEMATLAGVTLGELQNMSVYFSQPPMPVYEAKGGYAADAATVPVAAGQMVIRVEVNASYFIR